MRANDMKKIIFAIGAVFFVMLTVCCFYVFFEKGGEYCYTKVDSDYMEEQEGERNGVVDFTGGMKYLYTQPAYKSNGDMRTVTFGSNKVLKEGAYLKLTVVPIRGVTDWEEVGIEDLPEEVKVKFSHS